MKRIGYNVTEDVQPIVNSLILMRFSLKEKKNIPNNGYKIFIELKMKFVLFLFPISLWFHLLEANRGVIITYIV